jgi:hypothetical protein
MQAAAEEQRAREAAEAERKAQEAAQFSAWLEKNQRQVVEEDAREEAAEVEELERQRLGAVEAAVAAAAVEREAVAPVRALSKVYYLALAARRFLVAPVWSQAAQEAGVERQRLEEQAWPAEAAEQAGRQQHIIEQAGGREQIEEMEAQRKRWEAQRRRTWLPDGPRPFACQRTNDNGDGSSGGGGSCLSVKKVQPQRGRLRTGHHHRAQAARAAEVAARIAEQQQYERVLVNNSRGGGGGGGGGRPDPSAHWGRPPPDVAALVTPFGGQAESSLTREIARLSTAPARAAAAAAVAAAEAAAVAAVVVSSPLPTQRYEQTVQETARSIGAAMSQGGTQPPRPFTGEGSPRAVPVKGLWDDLLPPTLDRQLLSAAELRPGTGRSQLFSARSRPGTSGSPRGYDR